MSARIDWPRPRLQATLTLNHSLALLSRQDCCSLCLRSFLFSKQPLIYFNMSHGDHGGHDMPMPAMPKCSMHMLWYVPRFRHLLSPPRLPVSAFAYVNSEMHSVHVIGTPTSSIHALSSAPGTSPPQPASSSPVLRLSSWASSTNGSVRHKRTWTSASLRS